MMYRSKMIWICDLRYRRKEVMAPCEGRREQDQEEEQPSKSDRTMFNETTCLLAGDIYLWILITDGIVLSIPLVLTSLPSPLNQEVNSKS